MIVTAARDPSAPAVPHFMPLDCFVGDAAAYGLLVWTGMRPCLLATLIASLTPMVAYAQEPEQPNGEEEKSDAEEYVEAGHIEVGGSVGVSYTEDTATISVAPSIGYFFVDRFELTLAVILEYEREEDAMNITTSSEAVAVTLEPSYHHPLGDNLLALAGVAVGTGWDGDFWDFEIIPRLGMNVLTTASTAITPSVRIPILMGDAYGDPEGEFGVDVGVVFDVAVTASW
jgi:hypothetical protein